MANASRWKSYYRARDVSTRCMSRLCSEDDTAAHAHEILETAQRPKSPFPLWIWGFGLGHGLVNSVNISSTLAEP